MNLISTIRRHLGYKIFISYLVVILTGIAVLGISAEFVIPSAFNNHMRTMMGGGMMGMMGGTENVGEEMSDDLYNSFRSAVGEALLRAGLAAFIVALGVSIFVSRQVVSPIQEMTTASQYIAQGHYEQRVEVPGDVATGDLDELAQLALSYNQMAEKLYQTETMRRQLIGDISHELRTPLTTIKGSMEGLIDGVLPPTAQTFQDIYREADRLQRLVADLQELSLVESLAVSLQPEFQDIAPLIQAVAQRLEPQFQEKGIDLALEIPETLPEVRVDADRIQQVLVNLLGNALQYTPSDGRVNLTVQHIDEEIQVSVQDTGIGIPAEHLTHLFTRFYRVDKSRSRAGGGSGIGLTIAKHLVEIHGGRIWAESRGAGKGSTFYFTLPVRR